ncbi:MAG: hypothetical protein ACLQM6_06830 [Acidobacteriaceae bacterium]
MQRSLCGSVLLCGVLMTAAAACAQQTHPNLLPGIASADVALTYNLERAKVASSNCGCFWLNGASAEVAVPVYRGFSATGSFGGATASNIAPGVDLSKFTYVFGPRYTYNISRYTDRYTKKHAAQIVGEALFGGTHAFNSSFPAPGGAITSANSFAMQLGGGLDIALSRGFGVRALQLDYVRTSLSNNASNTQNDFRIAFGVTYRFAKH